MYVKTEIRRPISFPKKNNGIIESNIYLDINTCYEIQKILLNFIFIFPIKLSNKYNIQHNRNIYNQYCYDEHNNNIYKILNLFWEEEHNINLDNNNQKNIKINLKSKQIIIECNGKIKYFNINTYIDNFKEDLDRKIKQEKEKLKKNEIEPPRLCVLKLIYAMINDVELVTPIKFNKIIVNDKDEKFLKIMTKSDFRNKLSLF